MLSRLTSLSSTKDPINNGVETIMKFFTLSKLCVNSSCSYSEFVFVRHVNSGNRQGTDNPRTHQNRQLVNQTLLVRANPASGNDIYNFR